MFQPKNDRPQWQVVYERLATMDIDDVITDDELAALLPDVPEGSVASAYRRAVRQVEDDLKRTFTRVRTIGYRMCRSNEHEGLARGHHKRAKRQLKTAKRKATSADRSRLTREERARLDAVELNLARQIEMTNRLSARVEKVEGDLKAARREQQTDAAHLAERVDKLAALLEKHGIADSVPQAA